jgi:hypothetical protein
MNEFAFKKSYQDKAFLEHEYITLGKTSKQLSKELHVSYKLIEIWLKNFSIPVRNDYINEI